MPSRPAVEMHDHHRDLSGGAARAAIFGVSDGLVSNVSLILGFAGANAPAGYVRLAGLGGMIAGAFSMASGEYVSMKAHVELIEHELDLERTELANRPDLEQRELAKMYERRGVDADVAHDVAGQLMRDPEIALEVHAREELGVDPGSLGAPVAAATSSFLSFALGAVIPLLPWFFARGSAAAIATIALGATTAVIVGVALARFTGRPRVRMVARQLGFATAAAAVTFGVGRLLGVGLG